MSSTGDPAFPAASFEETATGPASSSTKPATSVTTASETLQSGQKQSKRVAFDPSVRPTDQARTRPRPGRPRHRMIYGIKLSEAGMRSWHAAHQSQLDTPPAHITGAALRKWWISQECLLATIIPMHCKCKFDIPMVDDAHITIVRDEGDEVCVVPLADTGARDRRYRVPPPEEVAEGVARFMHQEGDIPRWYRLARV
ncbi:hypothetical protein HDZ31DRAFT_35299 [Schizophyllum fasciatum]